MSVGILYRRHAGCSSPFLELFFNCYTSGSVV
jgi:hypothetical protein